jgi:hypothetical protein
MKTKQKGFLQLPHCFLDVVGMKLCGSEQLVFIHLSRFCYADRSRAFPSQTTLARLTGLSLSTVGRAIDGLIEKGAVKIVDRVTNGRWLNTYELIEWDQFYDLDDRLKENKKGKAVRHSDIDTSSKSDGQPVHNDSPSLSKCDKKNMNQEYEMNNTKFAADAAKPSASHEASEEPNEKAFTREDVTTADFSYDNTHKPKDISRFEFPKATLKEIQEKIYFWFREHDPLNVHKHKATLYQTSEEHLPLLIKAYSYLETYWKEYGYRDKSLIMFVQNLNRFCSEIENMRHNEDWQWRCDNRKPLLREFIRDHGLFDVTDREKKKVLMNEIKVIKASGHQFGLNEPQRRYLSNMKTLFAYQHVLKDDKWGGPFEDHELELLTEEAIYKCLRAQERCAS